jgi:hypothetical protein
MSLPQTFGTAHVWALYGVKDFVTLQSDDFDFKPALDVEVMNETGVVITDRIDDQRTEWTLSGVLKPTGTRPVIGDVIEYNSIKGIVKDITDVGANNAYRKFSAKMTTYQGISLT